MKVHEVSSATSRDGCEEGAGVQVSTQLLQSTPRPCGALSPCLHVPGHSGSAPRVHRHSFLGASTSQTWNLCKFIGCKRKVESTDSVTLESSGSLHHHPQLSRPWHTPVAGAELGPENAGQRVGVGSPAGMTGSCFWDSPWNQPAALTLGRSKWEGVLRRPVSRSTSFGTHLNARDPRSPLGSPGCGICPVSPEATLGVCHLDSDCSAWPDAVTLPKMFSIPSARVSECLPGQAPGDASVQGGCPSEYCGPIQSPPHPALLTSGWVTLWGEAGILGTVGRGWNSLHAPIHMMPGALSFDS